MRLSLAVRQRANHSEPITADTLKVIATEIEKLEAALDGALTMYSIFADDVHEHPLIEVQPLLEAIQNALCPSKSCNCINVKKT